MHSQHTQCFWNGYNTAWPFRGEPGGGRTVPPLATCSVPRARISGKLAAVANLYNCFIFLCVTCKFPWQKVQKHNELTYITNTKFKPHTIPFKILCTVYRSISSQIQLKTLIQFSLTFSLSNVHAINYQMPKLTVPANTYL
jgi:hypothetical protein